MAIALGPWIGWAFIAGNALWGLYNAVFKRKPCEEPGFEALTALQIAVGTLGGLILLAAIVYLFATANGQYAILASGLSGAGTAAAQWRHNPKATWRPVPDVAISLAMVLLGVGWFFKPMPFLIETSAGVLLAVGLGGLLLRWALPSRAATAE